METIAGDFSKLSVRPVADDVNKLPLSVQTVVSNDDLLSEILLRLPAISLLLFKSVSKRWQAVINDTNFIKRRSQIPKIDPPSGLFTTNSHNSHHSDIKRYDFVSFDNRIPACRFQFKTTFKIASESDTHVVVEQSCNGLLLCHIKAQNKYVQAQDRYCVYNPSVNLFKLLPQPHILPSSSRRIKCGLRMAFDPTKSPHYKVVYASSISDDNDEKVVIQIQTYSSETGNWATVCCEPYLARCFSYFCTGIYLNDAIHWLNDSPGYLHYKLDLVNERPILTTVQLPGTLHDWDRKLFECRDCLLLLGMSKIHSLQLNVYKMRNGHSEWSFKYFVNLCDIMTPISGSWSMRFNVSCIALGEREEDSYMVIKLGKKTFLYNFVLKTSRDLSELTGCFLFTASYASV